MNRPHIQERYQNAEQVHKFYLQVLQNFVVRLQKQYRYRSQIRQQDIDDIQRIVKEKISYSNKDQLNNKEHFEEYLGMKEASQKEILLKCEAEAESNFSKDKATISEYFHEQPTNIDKVKEEKQPEEEDSFDDLEIIEKEINQKDKQWQQQPIKIQQAKVQEYYVKSAAIVTKEHQNQDPTLKYSTESPADSSDDESSDNFMDIVNQKIGTALVGTFAPLQVKRRPKQEKIFIELQNVFVKFINCPFENYFLQVNCELTKIEKENIKIADK